MKKVVIYTAIAGAGRDTLRDPEPVGGVDYVCFTDQPFQSNVWNIRPFEFDDESNVIKAKHPKILPHLYFKNYDTSIWVDGNILPKKSIVNACAKVLNVRPMALHVHPRRKCLYEEIDHIKTMHWPFIDELLEMQFIDYFAEGMPAEFGLWECGILFRRHSDTKVKNAMELWWKEIIDRRQPRDQVGFAYTIWKTGLNIIGIHGDLRKKEYVDYVRHGIKKIKTTAQKRKEYIQSVIDKRKYKKMLSQKYA
jgi:hypothetical protein